LQRRAYCGLDSSLIRRGGLRGFKELDLKEMDRSRLSLNGSLQKTAEFFGEAEEFRWVCFVPQRTGETPMPLCEMSISDFAND